MRRTSAADQNNTALACEIVVNRQNVTTEILNMEELNMKKHLLIALSALLLLGAAPSFAADCVEVDIELPASVAAEAGSFAEGYFELTNCGDEAATVELNVTIAIGGLPPFEIGGIMFPLGAGEVVSREFVIPVPPTAVGQEVTICLDAMIGEATASDCATMVIEGASATSSSREIGFQALQEGDCVDVLLELSDTVTVEEGAAFGEGYFELTNCGDESALIMLDVTLHLMDSSFTISGIAVPLGAGETISREFILPVPPVVPSGEYGVCVTATLGESIVTSCETVVIVNDTNPWGGGTSSLDATNSPNPFNPSTVISFELPQSSHVKVTVYNTLGQQVTVLQDGVMSAGAHHLEWDAGNLSSGIYLYRIEAGDESVSKKMVLTK